jgi:hypothetical protein
MRLPVSLLVLLLSLSASAQPLRFGAPFPLPNTRYDTAIGAVKLVSTGDALYAFWSTGSQVRMSRVVEGERRGGVAVLNLRPEPFLSREHMPDPAAFDVVWTGTHFVVAGGAEVQGRKTIVTTAVSRQAEVFSPQTTIAGDGYEPLLAWNGRTLLMLYIVLGPDSKIVAMALPLNSAGRRAAIEAYEIGAGTENALASNGTTFAAVTRPPGESFGTRLVIIDENGRAIRQRQLDSVALLPAIASNGVNYLIALTDGRRLWADLVDGGGSPLAAHLQLDDLTNAPLFATFHGPSAAWSGADWVVVYNETRGPTLRTVTVDSEATAILGRESTPGVSTGSTIAFEGAPLTAWWTSSNPWQEPPLYSELPLSAHTPRELTFRATDQILATVASSGSAVLSVWSEKSGDTVSLYAGVRMRNGEWRERLLAAGAGSVEALAASDGNGFAVFVQVRSANHPTMPLSTAQVFLLDDRAALTRAPVDLTWWPEAVASNGESYAFAGATFGQLISPSGVLGPKMTITSSHLLWPSLTSDGTNYLYASAADPICSLIPGLCVGAAGVRAARLGPNLERLDATDHVLAENRELDRPLAAWNGRDYVVAWTDAQTGLTAAMLAGTGDRLTSRTISARTDLPVVDMIDADGGVLLLVADQSNATRYRSGLLFVDQAGALIQRNTFTHATTVTGTPRLALFDDGRLGYLISQFVDEAPQHGSSHVLLMLESPISPPTAPALTAATEERTVRLNWTAAAGAVSGYRVEYKIGDGSWNEIDRWFGANERSATFRLNRPGERAAFRVRAWGEGGTSGYSAAVTVNATRRRAVR